jgi:hypothetical protein
MVHARANIRRLGGGTSVLRGALVFRSARFGNIGTEDLDGVAALPRQLDRARAAADRDLRLRELIAKKRDEGRRNASQQPPASRAQSSMSSRRSCAKISPGRRYFSVGRHGARIRLAGCSSYALSFSCSESGPALRWATPLRLAASAGQSSKTFPSGSATYAYGMPGACSLRSTR